MSAVEAPPPSQPKPRSSRRGRHHGQGRPARQQNGQVENQQSAESSAGETSQARSRNTALALRPAALPPRAVAITNTDSAATDTSGDNASVRRTNGGHSRGGRGAGRTPRMVNGRHFGGQLTQNPSSAAHLQANAVEFVPGQPLLPAVQSQHSPLNAGRRRRPSKSTAPDILTRTHEDIEHGQYECPICTSEVQRNSKVWSCRTCWTVFHLTCIKKWASNEGSAAARRASVDNGEAPPPRQWRCPGCNLPKDEQPKTYTCWCGKETDPRPPTGIPPHSCGNTCGKDRVRKCPHPCQLTCHAGPCPPCSYIGPPQSCFCGKHEATKRCTETDYDHGWSCNDICGDIMSCGVHTCPQPCHEGLCGACVIPVKARCYCGRHVEDDIACHAQLEPQHSVRRPDDPQDAEQSWLGTFRCSDKCNRTFDCGVHHCERPCHSTTSETAHCPRSVDVLTQCPCGKTLLSDVTESPRSSCEDPIPNCQKKCAKPLDCGHTCEQICHHGACRPCTKTIMVSCVCGRTSSSTICHQGTIEPPQCMRVCNTNMSCGRHACDERCCTGERKAAERSSNKRKKRALGSTAPPLDLIEPEHICTRVCGRPLKCGHHTCEGLCHKGQCGSCREAIFEELPCHCGRTTLEPPLPCGTRPPPCRFQCERPKSCGHPQVQHTCHLNDETCPKCPFLVERRCMCGKKTLKNQQCWLQDGRCGQICGRKLKCGSHFCRKLCHKPGECEDAGDQRCQQQCGKPKAVCEHPDENVCHAPFPCKEDKPCTSRIFITCQCQAIKQEARCGASRSSEGNLNKHLPCTEECARLERNRRLAVALNIDQEAHVDGLDHVPYSDETLNIYQQHPQWSQTQEREYRVFADSPDEKRLRFKPMPAAQRAFLHLLAEDFGFDCESMDPEPHRHVLLLKTPRFVAAPTKTIAEAVRIRLTRRDLSAKAAPPSMKVADERKQVQVDEPFNALVLTAPRFGLVVEDIRAALLQANLPATSSAFGIHFLPSEEVLLKPILASDPLPPEDANAAAADVSPTQTEQLLLALKPSLASTFATSGLGVLQLCAADASHNLLRRESDALAQDGWSRVAAKAGAAPRFAASKAGIRGSNAFSALSGGGGGAAGLTAKGKVTFARKKATSTPKKALRREESVVEDWEKEMEDDEEEGKEAATDAEAAVQNEVEVEKTAADDEDQQKDGPVAERPVAEEGANGAQEERVDGLDEGKKLDIPPEETTQSLVSE